MTFTDGVFAKGYAKNGELVDILRYFKSKEQFLNVTYISSGMCFKI